MTLFAEEVVPRLRTKRASPTAAKTAVTQGGR